METKSLAGDESSPVRVPVIESHAVEVQSGRNGLNRTQSMWEKLVSWCTDGWLVELLSLVLAGTCILTATVILLVHDGKVLPQSPPLGLSLNAYLSLLSAVLKLSLAVPIDEAMAAQKCLWFSTAGPGKPVMDFERFDDAGRSPLGAMRLLCRVRARSVSLSLS